MWWFLRISGTRPGPPTEEPVAEESEFEDLPVEDPVTDLLINTEEPTKFDETVVDLDQVIDFKKEEKGGGLDQITPQACELKEVKIISESKSELNVEVPSEPIVEMGNQKEPRKIAGTDFDLDDLLDSIQTK